MSNATNKLISLLDRFQSDILDQISEGCKAQPKYEPPKINRLTLAKCRPSRGCCSDKKKKETKNSAIAAKNDKTKKANNNDDSSSSSSSDDDDNEDHNAKNEALEWLEHRAKQPFRLVLIMINRLCNRFRMILKPN